MIKGHNSLRQSVMGCLRHCAKVLPLALVAVVSSACSGQDDFIDSPTTSENKVQITFSLQFDNANTTRATVVDSASTGNDEHDRVQADELERTVGSMQVLLFGTDGKCMGEFKESDNPAFDGHTFYGWISREKLGTYDPTDNSPFTFSGKLVVLANCPNFDADTNKSLSDLQNVLYTYDSNFTSQLIGTNPTSYIPMWAVKTLTNEKLTPGMYHNVGEVDLLRAMAKIQINIDTESFENSGYELSSATLSKFNSNGHIVPTGYDTAEETAKIDQDKALNLNNVTAGTGTLSFSKASDKVWSLYTPELKNKEVTDGEHATVHLIVSKKNDASVTDQYDLQIGKYNDKTGELDESNTYYDLVRNHVYTYTLYMDKGVKLKLEVRKYNLREHNKVYM